MGFLCLVFRCVFASITVFLSPLTSLCNTCGFQYYLHVLDITAWLDIYLQFHVTYFNKIGLEISHPLRTAVHYLTRTFLIDVLGAFPFEYVILSLLTNTPTNKQIMLVRLPRLLQIHRIINGANHLEQNIELSSKLLKIVKLLPFVLIFINVVACVTINVICEFHDGIEASDNFDKGIRCSSESWITRSSFQKPISQIRLYLYGLYYVTSIISEIGLAGFTPRTIGEILQTITLSFVGFIFFIYINAKVISISLHRDYDLTEYQESIKDLIKFMNYRPIDERLKKEVIQHFEYEWKEKKGKELRKIISIFNHTIQQDVLFDIYGKQMMRSQIFVKEKPFFKSLVLKMQHEIILNVGIICRVNDIHDQIYFIYKGQVEVLGPDRNRMCLLPVGSMFGILDRCNFGRQTLTMIAKGNVELLSISSNEFHDILANYRRLQEDFIKHTHINVDYIPGGPLLPMQQNLQKELHVSTKSSDGGFISLFRNVSHQKSLLKIWEMRLVMLICYISLTIELFNISVKNRNWSCFFLPVICDIFYIIHMYGKFYTGYFNKYGLLVMDSALIRRRYRQTELKLDLLSVLPFEIISLIFINTSYQLDIYNYMKLNRLLRIYFICRYFGVRSRLLNINVYWTRTLYVVMWITLMVQIICCIVMTTSCITPTFNTFPLLECQWRRYNLSEAFRIYTIHIYKVLYICTAVTVRGYFPNSAVLILIFTLVMIFCRFMVMIFISEMAAVIHIVRHNRTIYETRFTNLASHMEHQQTSPYLLRRVKNYCRYLWRKNSGLQFPTLLEQAPYYLREGVLNSMYGHHLRKHPLFKHCHVDLLRQIAVQLRPQTFFTGDYITFVSDVDECMYFIQDGSVDALDNDTSEKVKLQLQAGEMFGVMQGLYPNCGHIYTYRANRYTVVLTLKRSNWINLLDFFPASKNLIYDQKKAKMFMAT